MINLGKLLMLMAINWWVFLILFVATASAHFLFKAQMFAMFAIDIGSYWWIFMILLIISVCAKFLFSNMHIV